MALATQPTARREDEGERLLRLVEELSTELRGTSSGRRLRVDLESDLESDLGLDSLARIELLQRVEREFDCRLPDETLRVATSAADLLHAVQAADNTSAHRLAGATQISVPVDAGDALDEPHHAATLLDALAWHVARHPERTQIILAADSDEERIDFATLDAKSRAVAGGLQALGVRPRQSVALMLPTGAEYFYAFIGTLLAGAIPVPIYPPFRPGQIEDHVLRHAGILGNAQARVLITVPQARTVARLLEAHVPSLDRVTTVASLRAAEVAPVAATVVPGDIAFLQYTSGSTGNPKGVEITHAGLLANIRAIGEALEVDSDDVFVSWLPLYHDMGLISAWLASLYFGNPLVTMSPLAFLSRPERWLWAIHRYHGTLTAAPNFAYEFCVGRIGDASIEGLDLSSLRFAANGAEPVSADTLERFTERYASYGLRPEAIAPVYGLAEATVGLTCPPMRRGLKVDRVAREHFIAHGEALSAACAETNPLRFVACGPPLPGMEIRVVDGTGSELGERSEGRLEFRGPSATPGYHREPVKTDELMRDDGWLDTGDRAFIAEGDLYVTGRVKDIIIRGGRNLYPQEIEEVVGEVDGVRKGCVAVFGSAREGAGTERLIVLAETRETDEERLELLRSRVAAAVLGLLGEPADEIALAPPRTVLKTSSGKVRRAASKAQFDRGEIGRKPRAAWWQFVRLLLGAKKAALDHLWRSATAYLYAARFWSALVIVFTPAWLVSSVVYSPRLVWKIGRAAGKAALWLAGVRVIVKGIDHVPHDRPCVLVANHQSYLDGLAVLLSQPSHFTFVAKRELASQFVAGTYLRRLGVAFVDRFDASESLDAASELDTAAARGKRLAFFPEGTFSRAPGLQRFRLGAFTIAAQNRICVLPVAIRGTRSILRGEQLMPRRGIVTVTVTAPIEPANVVTDTFAEAVRLREQARTAILERCGESDLPG